MHRREWLSRMGAVAAAAAVAGCAKRATAVVPAAAPPPVAPVVPLRRFAPVHVSPDRVIRTMVGLRPFRPSGFVVRAERAGDKTIVHNYGHGGGGVTLSWGTAHLAAEFVAGTGVRAVAVVGCGVIGLSTTRLLQERGYDVTIYARELPPNTTSNVAGAQWSPYTVADDSRRTPTYNDQFARATRFAHRYFQDLVGDVYGVRWIENYVVSQRPFPTTSDPATDGLYPDSAILAAGEHPFQAPYVRRFATMLIEPSIYLPALVRDVRLAGARIVVRDFADRAALQALPEPVIVNCTGLGARALFSDEELIPIKGQLTVLLPQPEIDYIVLAGDMYMFPRRDGILLGGTHERGEWSLDVNRTAERAIVEAHQKIFAGMRPTA